MNTTTNNHTLQKIVDFCLVSSLTILLVHFYYYCYAAFAYWHLTASLSDRLLLSLEKTGLFVNASRSKMIALILIAIAMFGSKGRKEEKLSYKTGLYFILAGLSIYLCTGFILELTGSPSKIAFLYMGLTDAGFILFMIGAAKLRRVLKYPFNTNDPFNKENTGFPQEEAIIRSKYSINLPATYTYKGRTTHSWINFINPRRGILIMGSPGSGKSYFIIDNMIRQFSEKGFALFVYDFKYPTLTNLVYNQFLQHQNRYPTTARFYSVNFTDLSRTHCCNLLDPDTMEYIADAIGASRTILYSINKTWVHRQGDFWVESPVTFLAALIWWLRKYEGGIFCTLPHAIELAQVPYDKLFTILNAEPEVSTLVNPFINAYRENVMETLDSQVSSAKIPLGQLASPELYYILTGNDLTLDINDPKAPKILCIGGDPQKQEALAPILSLYIDRVNKLINRQGRHKCAMICDEFATVRAATVLTTIATARSNDIVPVISVQDLSQLRTRYSREEAELILNITGNLICGQVGGETARWVSERFPSVMQDKTSISINSNDTSVSKSLHLEKVITPATIANLSSGEFLGITSDDPEQKLELKAFHASILNDHTSLARERHGWQSLPTIRDVDTAAIRKNFLQIKRDIQNLVNFEMTRILGDDTLSALVVKRKQ